MSARVPSTGVRSVAALALGGVLLTVPDTAAAAPDRAGAVSAGAPVFAWEGPQAHGRHVYWTEPVAFDPSKCSKQPETYCDVTHVRLEAQTDTTATLKVKLTDYSSPSADFDVYVYESDAAGGVGKQARTTGCCQPAGVDENVTVSDAAPGYYLVFVPYWMVPNDSYKGSVEGVDIVAPPTAPPSPSAPSSSAPSSSSPKGGGSPGSTRAARALPFRAAAALGSARTLRRRRAVSLQVTAGEPITNLRVELRPLRGRGRVLGRADRRFLARGRARLRLTVPRGLRRGSYALVASGVVAARSLTLRQTVRVRP